MTHSGEWNPSLDYAIQHYREGSIMQDRIIHSGKNIPFTMPMFDPQHKAHGQPNSTRYSARSLRHEITCQLTKAPETGQSEDDPRRTSPIVVFPASNLHFSPLTYLALQQQLPSFSKSPPCPIVLKFGRAHQAPFPLCDSVAERPSACRLVISTKTLRPFLPLSNPLLPLPSW